MMNKRTGQKLHLYLSSVCFICGAFGMGDRIYNFSTPDLLREKRGTDLMIRSNVVFQHVISTLYLNIACCGIRLILHQLPVTPADPLA